MRPARVARVPWIALAGLMAASCTRGPAGPPPPPPPQKTVFDPMLEQRDKVKEMADRLPDERKQALDKAIDGN